MKATFVVKTVDRVDQETGEAYTTSRLHLVTVNDNGDTSMRVATEGDLATWKKEYAEFCGFKETPKQIFEGEEEDET